MITCNCPRCYCAASSGPSRKAGLCGACVSGDHGTPREANRIRICPACHLTSIGLDVWPEACLACREAFGPVALGWDTVGRKESGPPFLTSASDFARAIKADRRTRRGHL